jgi:2,4-dienoyl-CoA reductase-like NADH-dependent reductase (Old Yellow Enzyme family)
MPNGKILSRLDLGRLQIGHRAVLWAPQGADLAAAYGRLATPGGILASPPLAWLAPDGTGHRASTASGGVMDTAKAAEWRAALAAVHSHGAYMVARLQCAADAEGPAAHRPAGSANPSFPRRLSGLCFDIIEIGAPDHPPASGIGKLAAFPMRWLLAAVDRWGSDRVGVCVSAAEAFMNERSRDALCAQLLALNEMELAFLHLADCGAADVALDGAGMTQAARQLRSAFHGPMIVSGRFSPRDAVLLVGSRWADAVCLPCDGEDGPGLLHRLAAG